MKQSPQHPDADPESRSASPSPSRRWKSKRSEGQITRGKTRPNRLRRVDWFMATYDPLTIARTDGLFADALYVDVGFGEAPWTTLESAARLRRLNSGLRVVGVEIDPERVANAQIYGDALTSFRQGGFDLPLCGTPAGPAERVRLVRAFNVLRQYAPEDVAPAYELMGRRAAPGALLIEGTSDPFGRLWTANVLRRSDAPAAWRLEAMAFGTNFRAGFEPQAFQAVLPKSLIHRVVPGEPIHAFFRAWKQAAQETRTYGVYGLRQWFTASARRLAESGYRLDLRAQLLTRGCLLWRGEPDPSLTAEPLRPV